MGLSKSNRRALGSALLTLGLGLLATLALVLGLFSLEQREQRRQWQRDAERVELEIGRRLAQVDQVLRMARLLVPADGGPPALQQLTGGAGLSQLLPGLVALEWVQSQPMGEYRAGSASLSADREAFVLRARLPEAGELLGQDLGAYPELHELLSRARTQPRPVLAQGRPAGLGAMALALERDGWLLARLDLPLLLRGVEQLAEPRRELSLFDGPLPQRAQVLWQPRAAAQAGAASSEWLADLPGRLLTLFGLPAAPDSVQRTLSVGDRQLSLRVGDVPARWSAALRLCAAAGLLLSLLLALRAARLRARRERAQQAEQLRTQELEQRAELLRQTELIALRSDDQGRLLWSNGRLEQWLEREPGGPVGEDLLSLLDPAPGAARDALGQALADGRSCRVELQLRRRDGRSSHWELELQPLRDAGGLLQAWAWLGCNVDAAQRLQQDLVAALREQQALQALIGEQLLLARTDEQGRLLEINEAYARLAGRSRAELIGQPISVLASGHHPAAFWSLLWRRLLAGQGWRGQICNRARDGEPFWIDCLVLPLPVAEGGAPHYLALGLDISEARQAQAERARELERLHTLLEGMQAGGWEWNHQTGALRVNERFAAQLGESLSALQDWSAADWQARMHPEDLAEFQSALGRHLNGALPQFEVELRLRHALGDWQWLSLRGSVVSRTPQGQALWLAGTQIDIGERRAAAELERVRRQVLERTESLAGVGGFEFDLSSRRLSWTDEVFRLHGLVPGASPSLEQALRYVEGADRERLQQALERAEQQGQAWDLELRLRDALGHERWVRCVGELEAEGPGRRARRLVGALQDISQRRELEAAAQRQQQLLQAILEQLPCGLAVFDAERRLRLGNRQLAALLGQTLPQSAAELAERLALDAAQSQALLGTQPDFRFEHDGADGACLDLRGGALDDGGRIVALLDIGERKRSENALRAQLSLLHRVAETLPGRLAYWSADGRCVFANRAYADWLGPQAAAQPWGGAQAAHLQGLAGLLDGMADRREESLDGRPLLVHRVPDRDADGKVHGFVVLALEIAELKAAQRRTEELNVELALERDRANAASLAKSRFLADLGHEIRTPMNTILGLLKRLGATPLDARQGDALRRTEAAARSLLGLLGDLLDLARLEAGSLQLEPQAFGLDELLRSLALELADWVGPKALELVYELDPRLPARLIGDARRLQQLLGHLGADAIRASAAGEVVLSLRLVAEQPRLRLRCTLRDNAVQRPGGDELGLALARQLIGLMGGELSLQAGPGQGRCLAFEIELERAEAVPAPALGLRVLVLEDHPLTRAALCEQLQGLGAQALACGSLQQALDCLEAERASGRGLDAALVDQRLDGQDAWDAAQTLMQRGLRPLLLIGNAQGRMALAQRSGEFSPAAYLVKPIATGVLAEALSQARELGTVALREPPRRGVALEGLRLLLVETGAQPGLLQRLEAEGAAVELAARAEQALERLRAQPEGFDLVLLDLRRPGLDELAGSIRAQLGLRQLPIVGLLDPDAESLLGAPAGLDERLSTPAIEPLLACLLRLTQREAVPQPAPRPRRLVSAERQRQALTQGLDLQAALDRFLGQTDLYLRLCRSFSRSAQALPGQLRALSAAGLQTEGAQALHGLKGLAATLSAHELAEWGRVGEQRCRSGQGLDPSWIAALEQRLQQACRQMLGHAEALAAGEGGFNERAAPPTPAPAGP